MSRLEYELLTCERYERVGGKGQYDRGVVTSTLSAWSKFYEEVRRFQGSTDYVWRGQEQHGNGWTLRSTFDRQNVAGDRNKRLEQHKWEFAKAIKGLPGSKSRPLTDDLLWALGQHHGLATPLLDWTKSPFVAAYFAFRGKKTTKSERVVYALNRDIVRWYEDIPEQRLVDFPPIPSDVSVRFQAQDGVFTKALAGKDVKTYIQQCYHATNHRNRIILVEILIPDSCRDDCLKDLNEKGINHATLFPDIEGAALFCNWRLESDSATINSLSPVATPTIGLPSHSIASSSLSFSIGHTDTPSVTIHAG